MTSPKPVVVELPGWRDPLELLEASRTRRRVSLLLSGAGDSALARFSILTADPYLTVRCRDAEATIEGPDGTARLTAPDPFALLATLASAHPSEPAGEWPFAGGAVGCIAYDAARSLERLPRTAADDRGHPDLDFAFHHWSIAWDHAERRWAAIAAGPRARAAAEAAAAWALSAARRAEGPGRPVPRETRAPANARASLDRPAYLRAVRSIQDRIAAGDCYEVNLSRRISVEATPDGRRLFAALARRSPAPFAAYIETSTGFLAGSSPERFLRVRDGVAESRPIKGTARRARDPEADRRLAEGLVRSAKDRAENVMIVDLVRNDLGRVCEPGSIEVASLCAIESYASVHHLVSTVTGRLSSGLTAFDAARALFPPGSMTGAPKIRAMEVIEEIEPVRRGPYAGVAGFFSACGAADLSVVIRTLVATRWDVDLQAGGAVVADSDPAGEYEECLVKGERAVRALEEVLGRRVLVGS